LQLNSLHRINKIHDDRRRHMENIIARYRRAKSTLYTQCHEAAVDINYSLQPQQRTCCRTYEQHCYV